MRWSNGGGGCSGDSAVALGGFKLSAFEIDDESTDGADACAVLCGVGPPEELNAHEAGIATEVSGVLELTEDDDGGAGGGEGEGVEAILSGAELESLFAVDADAHAAA